MLVYQRVPSRSLTACPLNFFLEVGRQAFPFEMVYSICSGAMSVKLPGGKVFHFGFRRTFHPNLLNLPLCRINLLQQLGLGAVVNRCQPRMDRFRKLLHPGKMNESNPTMEIWKMSFLFNWVIFRFQPSMMVWMMIWMVEYDGLDDDFPNSRGPVFSGSSR